MHAQLMKDGEVDMTTGWNGRFDVAKKDVWLKAQARASSCDGLAHVC
jgi:hypothetical protein